MVRPDTYHEARQHLADMSEEELERYFWELAEKTVAPLIDLARAHTSPSIERSVLMRMGVDTQTGNAVVAECEKRGLLGHGAGHVVYVAMQAQGLDAPEAARRLAAGEGWDAVEAKWGSR